MINIKVTTHLRKLSGAIRYNYPTETLSDLENIAREVFNVSHIYHSFKEDMPGVSCASIDDGVLSIHYKTYTPDAEKLTLGHEIGHIAAGHLFRRDVPEEAGQKEADYFSARLNGLSNREYQRIMRTEREYFFVNILAPMIEDLNAVSADIKAVSEDFESVLNSGNATLKENIESLYDYEAELKKRLRSMNPLRNDGMKGL